MLENGSSQYKISKITRAFFDNLNLVKVSNRKRGEVKFKKKYILLDFWGTWCLPCVKAMPDLDKMNGKYNEKIQVVGFCIDEGKNYENARKIIQLNKSKWEQYFVNDKQLGIYDSLAKYGIIAFPTYILLDKNGNMIKIENDLSNLDLTPYL